MFSTDWFNSGWAAIVPQPQSSGMHSIKYVLMGFFIPGYCSSSWLKIMLILSLSTYALSHAGKVMVVPAMNPKMWKHPAVQKNVKILKSRGVEFIGPVAGRVACGDNGEGRMEEVPAILARILEELK